MSSAATRRCLGILCSLLSLIAVQTTFARPTPEQKCQAGKNIAAGKLAACLQNAEAKLATAGDAVKYAKAKLDCSHKFATRWLKLEAAATRVGATCLDTPLAVADFQSVIDAHTEHVATALGGGGLVNCPSNLSTCSSDLATCQADLAACEALPTGQVLKTGQTTAYGTGSDGDVQKGVARSYTDNGDGTITDNVTGLMWEKKSDDGGIHDKDNTYTWGMNTAPYTMDGTMVTTFLATLNSGGGFAGYTDWRIPNRFELESLVNLETQSPAVSPAFNTACAPGCTVLTCTCTAVASYYWSATTAAFNPGEAWRVGFNDGLVFEFPKNNVSYVRAVRTDR